MEKFKFLMGVVLFIVWVSSVQAQFKVRNDEYMQIGYEDYRILTFGVDTTHSPNNGLYAIEHWEDGLNFWKPWPAANWGNYILFLRDDKNVGIGHAGNSNFKLTVGGIAIANNWVTISDDRLKSDVKPIGNSLNRILQLNGVTYKYDYERDMNSEAKSDSYTGYKENMKDEKITPDDDRTRIGFIAQDLQKIVPEAVTEDDEGYLAIDYNEIIPLLVESVKEQQAKIDELENIIKEQENIAFKEESALSEDSTEAMSSGLYNNYPNPFEESTTISYFLSKEDAKGENFIKIYDQKGIEVKKMSLDVKSGKGEVKFETGSLGNGIYVYLLESNGRQIESKTMIISK